MFPSGWPRQESVLPYPQAICRRFCALKYMELVLWAAPVSWWVAMTSSPLPSASTDELLAGATRVLAYRLLLRRYRMNWRQ